MSQKAARERGHDALTPGTAGAVGPEGATSAPAAPQRFGPDDFSSFLSDVAAAVAQHVDLWKQQLAEASNQWGALGYSVAVLERALARDRAPNVEGLLATYRAAVEHLRQLEAQVGAIDPQLVGSPAFRDPERVPIAEAELARLLPPGPDAAVTRATLEVTTSNSSAAAAADAAVAHPAAQHNPLVVYGPRGSGRTHLLCAAANALRSWGSGRVAYVTATQFADELAAAMRENTVERWRARYYPLDVLAVDDVHTLAGNARAEQELALVCARLRDDGRQLLLATDATVAGAPSVGDALRVHLEHGHAVALGAPDGELCARVLSRRFASAGRDAYPGLMRFVTEQSSSGLPGVVAVADRLMKAADRDGVPLTLDFARAELGRVPARTPAAPVAAGGDSGRGDTFFLDAEKVVWDWPDAGTRMIEEMR